MTDRIKYVRQFKDRHGKQRIYFCIGGKNLKALRGPLRSPEFWLDYYETLKNPTIIKESNNGSFGKLLRAFLGSPKVAALAVNSKIAYRKVLDPLIRDHGHKNLSSLKPKHISQIIEGIAERSPSTANQTLGVLRVAFKYGMKKGLTDTNPTGAADRYKVGRHRAWTEAELEQYEARWPLGTRQRLAYALLLYTDQRVGDVANMSRRDVADGGITITQGKTKKKMFIPFLPELVEAMDAMPVASLDALIGAEKSGRKISAQWLSKMVKAAAKEAGLPPDCQTHGLRKAFLVRLAHLGYSIKEMQAYSGHESIDQLQEYVRDAEQKRLAKRVHANANRSGKLQTSRKPLDEK